MSKKEVILQTALKLLDAQSILEISINDIINQAHISKGGFFHYFTSKRELLSALIKYTISQMHSTSVGSEEYVSVIQSMFIMYITLSSSTYQKDLHEELIELENIFSSVNSDTKYQALQIITNNSYTKSLSFLKNKPIKDTDIEKVEQKNREETLEIKQNNNTDLPDEGELEEETVFVSDEFM